MSTGASDPGLTNTAAGSADPSNPSPDGAGAGGTSGDKTMGTDAAIAGGQPMTGSAGSGDPAVLPDPLPRRTPADANGTLGWVLVVNADAAYHARMQAQAEPDAEPIALPAFVPPRRFTLSGGQALIGRRSRSRGIEPEIDLSGPPADSAVSHAHALLLAGPDGSWAVVDLESANGTYINDDPDPIPPNAPCQLADGDRIHVGAWTTITLGHPS
jgi:hypothetical protein